MPKSLSNFQKEVLKEVGKSKLHPFFIWSGGTALSYQYLAHRKSYDLDFLSIFERAEPKDVFDLYCILQKRKTNLAQVLKWVEKKFGVEIDPVLFTSKISEGAARLKEIKPLILKKNFYNLSKIKNLFENQAHQYLKRTIKSE